MNSIVGSNFKVDLAKFYIYVFHKQYTGPSQKNVDALSTAIQTQPLLYFSAFLLRDFSLKVTKKEEEKQSWVKEKQVGIKLRAFELILNVKAKWPM